MSSTNLDRSLLGDLLGGASLPVVLNITSETLAVQHTSTCHISVFSASNAF